MRKFLPTTFQWRKTDTQEGGVITEQAVNKDGKHKIWRGGGKMASGKSEQTHVVTKTIKTMGPDGKMRTQVIKEETKVVRDGNRTITTTSTDTDGDSSQKSGLFGNFFKKKQPTQTSTACGSGTKPSLTLVSDSDGDAQGSSGKSAKSGNVSVEQFRKDALKEHNTYRAKHGAKPLKLNKDLNDYAQAWAEKMAKTGQFMHRPEHKYGENIYYGMNSRGITGEEAVSSWYNEVKSYNFSSQGFKSGTGHFTQVVWKDSTELGIGKAEPKPGHVYVVANYNPPGNVQGHFETNVSPAK